MATVSQSATMIALVQASTTLPAFTLAVFVGVLVDNFDRHLVFLIGRLIILFGSVLLVTLTALGNADPWSILGVTFFIGCGVALTDPAWQASVGDLVDQEDVPPAVTLINVGFNTIRSAGPALGGILVSTLGSVLTLAVSTLTYLVPVVTLLLLRWPTKKSALPRERLLTSIYDGVRFTTISSEIKSVTVRATLFALAGISNLALLPVLVRDQLSGGALAYGMLMGGFGLGALIGGLNASRLRRTVPQETIFRLSCACCSGCAFTVTLTNSVALAAIALSLAGAGWVIAWSSFGVSVQLASPRWVLGRTLSIYYAMTYGGLALGSWLWGSIADEFSLSAAFALSTLALAGVAAVGLVRPLRDPVGKLSENVEEFLAPTLAIDITPRSGPIVVRSEYLVAEENIAEFLKLMQERRNAYSKCGARNWVLERDLQQTSRWIETFRTPTWTDFLRLNHRLSGSQANLSNEIAALASQESPSSTPKISIERPRIDIRGAETSVSPVTRI